jgi:hypothetical protein
MLMYSNKHLDQLRYQQPDKSANSYRRAWTWEGGKIYERLRVTYFIKYKYVDMLKENLQARI